MENMISIPGYEFVKKIGEGGMATVWMARQVSLDRMVAIKILSPELLREEGAKERFHLEAQAAARLNHPGIIQVYDAGEHEGFVYIVMEFVAGCTVAELLDKKVRLSEKHALLIAEGVVLALGYAWEQTGIIHCDIKPENILIDQEGSVKLADMGLARFIGMSTEAEDRGLIEGTPHYSSPEQVRGDPDLDCRADIYSLGATLYHLVTGRVPFGDSDGIRAMERQVMDYLPDPMDVNHTLSSGVAWLIEKMMVKDRTLRYQTWQKVEYDLEYVKAEKLPAAKPPAAGQSTVLRSETRMLSVPKIQTVKTLEKAPAQKALSQKKKEESAGGKAVATKQKIVLPKNLRNQITRRSKKRGADLSRSVVSLLLSAIAVLVAYGSLTIYRVVRKIDEGADANYWEEAVSPESSVQVAVKPPPQTPLVSSPALAVSREQGEKKKEETINWRHPTFLKGARLFNDALAKYQVFQKTKQNPEILKTVEQQCREAIRAFEFVKPFAPDNVDVSQLIDQCYHLISDCRQSSLITSAKKTSSRRHREAPSTLMNSETIRRTKPRKEEAKQLKLAPNWNSHQRGGDRIIEDLRSLLEPNGVANIDLKPDTSLTIYGQVYYLMPVKEAARIMKKPPGPRKRMNCPGFPKDSFFYYVIAGNFGDGFNKILLITDSTDRIVAVQLNNNHPDKDLWLDPQYFQDRWHVSNFVEVKTKGNKKWKVGHRPEMTGRVLRIDTELCAGDPNGYFGLGDSKQRVSLYLPEPILNLILYRLQTLDKK